MRLLNTISITLAEFFGDATPPYAILSHTWEKEEVLLADLQNGTAESKKGYAKLTGCCIKAAEQGFQWVWIDTCCIDKTSSAELSEAINSMYQWYESSVICYAYLQDVVVESKASEGAATRTPSGKHAVADFCKSRWFTRGWTLQELLAPKVVEFYTYDWEEIGTKASLASFISLATDIPTRILWGHALSTCTVAERISWASARQTTREEDMAYCLLGLFGVNMPLLYGEGHKSFLRLQEQILKQEEDYSLFTWTLQHDCGESLTGFLASSPREFTKLVPGHLQPPTRVGIFNQKGEFLAHDDNPATFASHFGDFGADYDVPHSKNYEGLQKYSMQSGDTKYRSKQPPELTSRGLRISLPVLRRRHPGSPTVAWVYCGLNERLLCIGIRPCAAPANLLHGRHAAPWLVTVDKSTLVDFVLEDLIVHPNGLIEGNMTDRKGLEPSLASPSSSWGRLRVFAPGNEMFTTYVISAYPLSRWSLDEFFFDGAAKEIGTVMVECVYGERTTHFVVCCGIRDDHPWCTLQEVPRTQPTEEAANYLAEYHDDVSNDRIGMLVRSSDRAAVRSLRIARTVFTAAIRRTPTSKAQTHVYSLYVGAHDFEKRDAWVERLLATEDWALAWAWRLKDEADGTPSA